SVRRLAERLDDRTQAARLVDRNDAGPFQQMTQAELLRPAREDDEANDALLSDGQEEPIEIADVIADEQGRSRRGKVLDPADAQPIDRVGDDPERDAHQQERVEPEENQRAEQQHSERAEENLGEA